VGGSSGDAETERRLREGLAMQSHVDATSARILAALNGRLPLQFT